MSKFLPDPAAAEGPPRLRQGPGVAAGVDEPMIRRVVHAFYADIRRDAVLGPIFNDAIAEHWDAHLEKLCDFWSSVLLMTGRFKGRPMQAHAALPDIERSHFARWLEMFSTTVRRECPPDAAALFEQKSRMIAESLMLGLDVARGVLPPRSPRQ